MDGKRMALAASAVLLLVGCSSAGQGGGGGSAGGGDEFESEAQGAPQVQGAEGVAIPLPGVRPTVIKTANLRLEVEPGGAPDAMSSVTAVASSHGGFILRSESIAADQDTVTIRVPSRRFEAALRRVRALGEVTRSVVDGQDVSEEFVDLEARLRNLQAEQAVMLRLFDEAATIPDTIRVQEEVSAVQLQIEQIRGRLRFLRDQTSSAR